MPPEGAHMSIPGITTYGTPEIISAVQEGLSPYVKPRIDCPDIKLGACSFRPTACRTPIFINVHDGKEYVLPPPRALASPAPISEMIQELREWDKNQTAAVPTPRR